MDHLTGTGLRQLRDLATHGYRIVDVDSSGTHVRLTLTNGTRTTQVDLTGEEAFALSRGPLLDRREPIPA